MILDMPITDQYHYANRRTKHQRAAARHAGKQGTLTAKAWLEAIRHFSECCAYCGRHASEAGQMTLDHYQPLSDPESKGTVRRNCLPACTDCNQSKAGHAPQSWIVTRFGASEGAAIIARIQAYFDLWATWHGRGES